MTPHLCGRPGNPHASDHVFGWEANSAVEKAAADLASVIRCDARELVFTSGATEANNLAILGVAARASSDRHRRRILISAIEHKCVLAAARVASERFGCVVETVPVNYEGFVELHALRSRLAEDVLLVSIMAVNNEIGTIQPIAEIALLTRRVGALFHTDAVQALVAGNIDVQAIDADLLSLSAHKIYGPQGIGALFVRQDLQPRLEPLIYGGGQQHGLRSGTVPVHLCVGLATAATLMVGPDADDERVRLGELRDRLAERLCALGPATQVNGARGVHRHPGNANIRFDGYDARDILAALQPRLAASTGSACTSGIPEPSHVLRAIGLSVREAEASIRFSIGRFTTSRDVDDAVDAMAEVLADKALAS